jgi:Large polyvalent protein associated domain 22
LELSDLDRFLAPPQSTPKSEDPLVADLRERQRRAASLHIVRDEGSPDKAGRANELSRRFGVPAETVERNLPQFEAAARQRQASPLLKDYPAIGKWAAEPRHAAVGRDDIPNLARISKAFHDHSAGREVVQAEFAASMRKRFGDLQAPAPPKANVRNFFGGVGNDFVQSMAQIRAGLRLQMADFSGNEEGSVRNLREYERRAGLMAAGQPEFKSGFVRGLYSGVSSLAQILPATIASIATGNPVPVLAYAGASSGTLAYGKYRARGATPGQAAVGGIGEGSVETLTEILPMGYIVKSFGKAGFGSFVTGLVGREIPTEQIATFAQDAIDASIANPDMTLAEFVRRRPDAAYQTLIASVTQSVLLGAPAHLAQRHSRQLEAREAEDNAALIEGLDGAASESRVRQRDPEAFRSFIETHSEGTPVESVYIPGEVLRELYQSDSTEGGFLDNYSDQIAEAVATGGDVVISLADAATHLAGTPVWDAIKDDVRLSPGGVSAREARSFDESRADEWEAMGRDMAARLEQETAAQAPREQIVEQMRDKLMRAGYRPDVAQAYAEMTASRYATRAARLGQELTGSEANKIEVRRVLPPRLAEALAEERKSAAAEIGTTAIIEALKDDDDNKAGRTPDDGLLAIIDIMRRKEGTRTDRQKFGPSLLDWIAAKGGIEDRGGDLKAMGLASLKGVAKKGQRKLIRSHVAGQSSMIGEDSQQNSNSPDELALRAWEAGYFPEFSERPSVNDLLDAISEGISGRERYANDGAGEADALREAAQELYALLDQQGLDPDAATPQEIGRAIEQYQAEAARGYGYEQLFADPEQPYRHMTAEQRAEIEARQQQSMARRGGQEAVTDQEGGLFSAERDQGHLFQSYMEGPRGRITFASDGKSIIDLFEKRDLSTFVHESGHLYLEELKADAEMALQLDTPEGRQIFADWEAVKAWFKREGAEIGDDGSIPTEAHELWARGFERFAMEGKPPSSALRKAFEAFRSWLLTIYKVVENLRSPISEEVRAVMERLLATDQEIAEATEAQNIKALFKTPEEAAKFGMTGAAYAEYQRATEEAREEAYDALLYRTMSAIRQSKTKEWREQEKGVKADVMEAIDRQPVFRALRLLTGRPTSEPPIPPGMVRLYHGGIRLPSSGGGRWVSTLKSYAANYREGATLYYLDIPENDPRLFDGGYADQGVKQGFTFSFETSPAEAALMERIEEAPAIRLDRNWLVDTYGAGILDQLPKRVPPIHSSKDATHADMIAEMSGFATADEMVRMLTAMEAQTKALRARGDKRSIRQVQIDEMTSETMLDRHGDILNDGSIEDEARALIHNDRQGEVIASEIRALGRRANKQPTPYALAKEWAAGRIAGGKVAEAISGAALQRYERAARGAAKRAEAAMLADDVNAAFREKQAQMLNNALIVEAKKAKDRVDIAVRRLGKLAKRATVKGLDQGHLDQVHGLLEQVEFRIRSQRAIDRQESFEAWAQAQQAAGFDIVAPPSFAASLGQTNWSRLTVEQIIGLDDTVKQIVHLGRLKQTLIDNKDKRDFDAVVGEAVSGAANLPPRAPSDLMEPSRWDSIKSRVASMDAALLKMETVFDWLDGGNSNGVFNRIVFRRIAEAQHAERTMIGDYVGRLTGHLRAIPKEQLSRWFERVSAPELLNRETGRPWIFTRDQLVSMALNMGNAGNAKKLAGGYGWSEEAVMAVLDRELSAADWQYVQNVWDTIETLWPQIAALEKRLNGIEPEKVEARPINTSAGTLRGGYFPVVYDPRKSLEADMQGQQSADSLFENIYTRATTPRGFTQARTTVERPIHLSLGIITRHVSEVIHDITHREAVMDADRFLSDKRVMKAVDDTLGPEVRKQFRPWLQHIANEWAADRAGNSGFEAFLKKMRTNATVVGLGLRVSTMQMQLAGYSNSAEVVGAGRLSAAIAKVASNPVAAWEFVSSRSAEVRHRMDTLDRDINDAARRATGRMNPLTEAQRFYFHGIGYMDRVVVVPTWIAAYNKGIEEGMTEEEAGYYGDKVVRQSQGAGAAKDLAAVQRGTGKAGEMLKFLTMYYSYMSAVYQRQRTFARDVMGEDVRRPRDVPALMSRALWLFIVPPLLAEMLAGRGPDDDDDLAMWSFSRVAMQMMGPIPIVRDVSTSVFQGFDYKMSPASRGAETAINTAGDAATIASGGETKHATKNALETIGYTTGLVPGQVATAAQFLVDVSYDEQDPEDFADWYRGLTKGKVDAD